MSPEIISKKKLSSKTDIWSAGVILFNLITGDYHFDVDNKEDLFRKVRNEEPYYNPKIWGKLSS